MTYKEKLREIHPGLVGPMFIGGAHLCPDNFFEGADVHLCSETPCNECWDREYKGEKVIR